MDPLPLSLLLIACGFLLGSIPFGWLAARLAGRDIRQLGSGNIGATNVWRALGWKWGLPVLLLDALKGWVAAFVASRMIVAQWTITTYSSGAREWTHDLYGPSWDRNAALNAIWFWEPTQLNVWLATYIAILVGIAAILGHTFTPWLRFRGGKGVATGLGVAIALYSWWILLPLAVFLLALFATRMVSVGSIFAALAIATLSAFVPWLAHLWPFGVLGALLVVWTHRANLRRIMAGTENKVSFGRPGGAARR